MGLHTKLSIPGANFSGKMQRKVRHSDERMLLEESLIVWAVSMGSGVHNKRNIVKCWKVLKGNTSLESEGYSVSLSEIRYCF